MNGIFLISEEISLAAQLLTPALALKAALGQPVTAIVLSDTEAEELVCRGADTVVVLRSDNSPIESLGQPIAKLVKAASVLLVGSTSRGKHLAATIAAELDTAMTTDARTLRMEGDQLITTRMFYTGLAICEEELFQPAVVTVAARTFLAPPVGGTRAAVNHVATEADNRVSVVAVTPLPRSGTDVTMARRLVSVGRGFRKRDDLALAQDLADALGAELCCSRSVAEDEHWLPLDRYVGISGRTVRPDLYCAVGLSGQVQHMIGARESKIVVAINADERAPVFQAADYGIVGDLYEVLPLLTSAIKG